MILTTRLFASFREKIGTGRVELDLPAGARVRDLLEELGREYPAIGQTVAAAMVAVNLEYVGPDYELREGDEVALIPPVSGGSA